MIKETIDKIITGYKKRADDVWGLIEGEGIERTSRRIGSFPLDLGERRWQYLQKGE